MMSVIFIRTCISFVDQVLRLDDFQSFEYGMFDRVGIGHGFLRTVSFCISSLIGEPKKCLLAFPTSMSMRSSLLDDILRD